MNADKYLSLAEANQLQRIYDDTWQRQFQRRAVIRLMAMIKRRLNGFGAMDVTVPNKARMQESILISVEEWKQIPLYAHLATPNYAVGLVWNAETESLSFVLSTALEALLHGTSDIQILSDRAPMARYNKQQERRYNNAIMAGFRVQRL